MNKKNSLVNRILALLLAVVMIFSNSLTSEAAQGTNTLVGVKNSGGAYVNNFGQLVVIPVLAVTDLKHSGFERVEKDSNNNLLTINRDRSFFGTKSSKKDTTLNTVYFLPDIDDDAYYGDIFTDLNKQDNHKTRDYEIEIAKKYLSTKGNNTLNLTGMMGTHWFSECQLDKECFEEYEKLTSKGKKNFDKASLSTFFKKLKITMASYSLGSSKSTVSQIIDKATTDARKAFNKCAFFTVDTTANGYGSKTGWKHALYTEAWESKGEDYDGFLPQLQQLIDDDADITFRDISEDNPIVCNLGFIIIFLPCDGYANLIQNGNYIWMTSFGYANKSKVDEYITAWGNLANGGLRSSYLVAKSVWGMTGSNTNSITSNFGTLKKEKTDGVYVTGAGFRNKRKKITVRTATKSGDFEKDKRNVALVDSKYSKFTKKLKAGAKEGNIYLFDCSDTWTNINSRGVYTAIVSSATPEPTTERAHLAADMVFAIEDDNSVRLVQQDFIQFKATDEDADENTLTYEDFDYDVYDDTGMDINDLDADDKVFDNNDLGYNEDLALKGYVKYPITYVATKIMPADTPLKNVGGFNSSLGSSPWVFTYTINPNFSKTPVSGGTEVTHAYDTPKGTSLSHIDLNIGVTEALSSVTIESTNPGSSGTVLLKPDGGYMTMGEAKSGDYGTGFQYINPNYSGTSIPKSDDTLAMMDVQTIYGGKDTLQELAYESNNLYSEGYASGNNTDGSKARYGQSNGGIYPTDITDVTSDENPPAKIYKDADSNGQAVPTSIEIWHKFGTVSSQMVKVPIKTTFDSVTGKYSGSVGVGEIKQIADADYNVTNYADFTLPEDTIAVIAVPNKYYTDEKVEEVENLQVKDMAVGIDMPTQIADKFLEGVPAASSLYVSSENGISGGEHFCVGEDSKDGFTIIVITSDKDLEIETKTTETDEAGVMYGQVVLRSYQLNKFTSDILSYCTGFDHALTTRTYRGGVYDFKDFYLRGKEYISDGNASPYHSGVASAMYRLELASQYNSTASTYTDVFGLRYGRNRHTTVSLLDLSNCNNAAHDENMAVQISYSFDADINETKTGHKINTADNIGYYYNTGFKETVTDRNGDEFTKYVGGNYTTSLQTTRVFSTWRIKDIDVASNTYKVVDDSKDTEPEDIGIMTYAVETKRKEFDDKKTISSISPQTTVKQIVKQSDGSEREENVNLAVILSGYDLPHNTPQSPKKVPTKNKNVMLADILTSSIKWSGNIISNKLSSNDLKSSGYKRITARNGEICSTLKNTTDTNVKVFKYNGLHTNTLYNSEKIYDVLLMYHKKYDTDILGTLSSLYLPRIYSSENPKGWAYDWELNTHAKHILDSQIDSDLGDIDEDTEKLFWQGIFKEGTSGSTSEYHPQSSNYEIIAPGTTDVDKKAYIHVANESKTRGNIDYDPQNAMDDISKHRYERIQAEFKEAIDKLKFNTHSYNESSNIDSSGKSLAELLGHSISPRSSAEIYYEILKNTPIYTSYVYTERSNKEKAKHPELSLASGYGLHNVFYTDKEKSVHRTIHFAGTRLDYQSVKFIYHERAFKYSPSDKGIVEASKVKVNTTEYKDALIKNTLNTSDKIDGTLVFRDGVVGDTDIKKASATAKLYDVTNVGEYAAGKTASTATNAKDYNWVSLWYYPEVQMAYYSTIQKDKITGLEDVSRHVTKVMADEERKSYSSGLYIYSLNTGLEKANESQHTDGKYAINPTVAGNSVKGATISSGYQVTTDKASSSNPIAYAGSDITLNVDSNFTINLYGYALDVTDKNDEGRATIEAHTDADGNPVPAQEFGYTVSTKTVKKADGLSTLVNGYETEKTALEKYHNNSDGGRIADGSDVYDDWENWQDSVTNGGTTVTKRNTDRLLEQYKAWANSMLNPNNYKTQLSLEIMKGATKSKEYDEFNVSFGKIAVVENGKVSSKAYNGDKNNSEDGVYALNFENGELIRFAKNTTDPSDKDEYYDSRYLALITQIADDANISLKDADEMFMTSNLYTSILNAIQSDTDPASENGSGCDDLGKKDVKGHLGNETNWYDEKVKTIVVRRFKTDSVTLSGIVCQDKLDYNITSAGSQDKYTGKWYFSTQLVDIDHTGIATAGNKPSTNVLDIINHNYVENADFDIRNASQDAGN